MSGSPMQAFRNLQSLVAQADPHTVASKLPTIYTKRNFERESLARRIGAFMEWRKRGGFQLEKVLHYDHKRLDVEVSFPVTQDLWRLRILLDEDGSGLIDELLMGRAPLLPDGQDRSDDEIAQSICDYITHLARHDLFSGAVLIARHGEILATRAVGYASREYFVPNSTKTLFNVASLTKSWTAVAAARLIEIGHLDLEASASSLVKLQHASLDRRIKIKHLMSHTAGLGDYFGREFSNMAKDQIRSIDDFINLTPELAPAFPPGSDWAYSNIGMMVLGKVIERVTGDNYYNAVAELVFEPAGMKTAFFPHLDEIHTNCANGYGTRWTNDGPVTINALHSWAVRGAPDGCAFASLADVWAFVDAFHSGKLVSKKMAREMTSPKPDLNAHDYGYGFAVMPERAIVGHSGGLIGASANLDMINEPNGWTVIVLANDLSMRTAVIKARQLIGVTVQERDDHQTNMPRAGLTAR